MSALASASPLMAGNSSPFDGIPGIRFRYYAVGGRTPLEIYRSMSERGPDDGEALARTTWEMSVNWHEATRGAVCRVDEPRTRMSITVLLPRLERSDELTREGLAFWRATIRGLEIHEAGHARIAWDHREDFNRVALRASCKTIDRVARAVQGRIEAIQQAYDRDTDHGRKQTPELEL